MGRVNFFTEEKERELLELKKTWGFDDPRNTKEYEDCDICANDIFRDSWTSSGVERRVFDAPPPMGPRTEQPASQPQQHDQQALVQTITDRVMAELQKR